jgi:exodeoxyribonuclease VII large subunit
VTLPFSQREILTVSQLTVLVKTQLETAFSDVWMEGEISNLRSPGSGHLYFTLKDAEAQMRAVFFRSGVRSLKFVPKDGLQVICRGRITVYEPRGEYQIVLDYMEPKGIGALQLAFEQLKERLWKEGLFDDARKRPIPILPQKIGIVTSPTGAALRDILKVIRRRFANVDILVAPASVQGDRAVPEIIAGIEDLNARTDVDVIILARGGGSIEDLWAFNDEALARAIYRSRIPVISAVGHEIDTTIADFAADLRAPTPSAAAERVVQNKEDLERTLDGLDARLNRAIFSRVDLLKARLTSWVRLLPKPLQVVQRMIQRLDDLKERLSLSVGRRLQRQRERLDGMVRRLYLRSPGYLLEEQRRRILHDEQAMARLIRHRLQLLHSRLGGIFSKLHALSPLSVLERGYSIARKLPSLSVLRSAAEAAAGDSLLIRLHEGEIRCRVEETFSAGSGGTGPGEIHDAVVTGGRLPAGKLPMSLLERLLNRYTTPSDRVVIGPAVGVDATAIDFNDRFLLAKTDPITFVAEDIGAYAVHINANDIAVMGGTPKWFLATILLPEGRATEEMAESIFASLSRACRTLGVVLCGGHTEITGGIDRPLVIGQMLGEAARDGLISSRGARPGDALILTKGIAIEGTSILAREMAGRLKGAFPESFITRCKGLIDDPGVSVVADARIAVQSGRVHAMHDPTEGGLASGLHEMALASGVGLRVDSNRISILPECRRLCDHLGLDPLGVIASGALLLSVDPDDAEKIVRGLEAEGISAAVIGGVTPKEAGVRRIQDGKEGALPLFDRDEIARLFSSR